MIREQDKNTSSKVDGGEEILADPVCGMTVARDSKFQYEYKGEHYYFCSDHCLREFKEHTEQYLKKQALTPQN